MRKISKGRNWARPKWPSQLGEAYLKKRRRKTEYAKQQVKGVLKHRKEFNDDILRLLNYYRFNYLLSLNPLSRPLRSHLVNKSFL